MSDASDNDQPPDAPAARTIFDVDADREREMRRLSTRRIALWGLLTGIAMAVIFALCVLLFFLATWSGS